MKDRTTLLLLLLIAPGGCSPPAKPSLVSNDPTLKVPAIKDSARQRDEKAVQQLVKDLDSDDPAVRFYSITALKEITGQTFDYRYYDDEIARLPALKRWQAWLSERQGK